MKKLLLLFLLCAGGLTAQVSFPNPVRSGPTLPAKCTPGALAPAWFLLTAGGPVATPYWCDAPNHWSAAGGGVGAVSLTGGTGISVSPNPITDTGVITNTAVCTTTITTGTTATLSTCFTVNQEATAGTGVTYTLPTAASGLQFCIDSGWNGSAANTGVLTLATSASGQFMVFTDGTLTATGGNVTSGGAARDGACVYGIDSTHWMFLPHSGVWTKH